MTLFGEFRAPTEEFALHHTLRTLPDAVIEIERVVATDEALTPYFWLSGDDVQAFEATADQDASVSDLRRLDEFEEATLYRAEWTEKTETLVYAYTTLGATILDATGRRDAWRLRMQFDERDHLDQFGDYCREQELDYTLTRLHDVTASKAPSQFGLTEKQEEALVEAWEMGYFETPRTVTLADIAGALQISEQALSNRLRRGYDALIANTLRVTDRSVEGADT